jgi:hypothetical protein
LAHSVGRAEPGRFHQDKAGLNAAASALLFFLLILQSFSGESQMPSRIVIAFNFMYLKSVKFDHKYFIKIVSIHD